ncbi:MAG TPA: hypothetical protein VF781_16225 [Solirubrobacteraceae bacterium]
MALSRLLSARLVAGTLFAATALAVLPAAADAAPGHFRGVVPANTPAGRAYAKLHSARRVSNLNYYGGPVMHTDANYAIYWDPSGLLASSQGYASLINPYFSNVAAASSLSTNVYAVAKQYYDSGGHAFSSGAIAGRAFSDTDPYPASGCRAAAKCITDAQLQTELKTFLGANGLPSDLNTMYFVYFPSGVATCFNSSGSQCSTNTYCAYHSSYAIGTSTTLYANMPYAGVSGCESGQYPNGSVAGDSALNLTSHENIEAITDPLGNAWYDSSGSEIGDKCAWNFGSQVGSTSSGEYNQAIGSGGYYWLQQEWSNAISGCALQM